MTYRPPEVLHQERLITVSNLAQALGKAVAFAVSQGMELRVKLLDTPGARISYFHSVARTAITEAKKEDESIKGVRLSLNKQGYTSDCLDKILAHLPSNFPDEVRQFTKSIWNGEQPNYPNSIES